MSFNLDSIVEQILQNPKFLRLKNIVENNAYHDNEDVFSHLVKTMRYAKIGVKGDFIKDDKAREKFVEFVNGRAGELKVAELMVLTALLHDVGKMLSFEENGVKKAILVHLEDGSTLCPNHEYWGAKIVDEFLSSLPKEAIEVVREVVEYHYVFGGDFFQARNNWSKDRLIEDTKRVGGQYYLQILFNSLWDCYDAKPFEQTKEKIIELFNIPRLYLSFKFN